MKSSACNSILDANRNATYGEARTFSCVCVRDIIAIRSRFFLHCSFVAFILLGLVIMDDQSDVSEEVRFHSEYDDGLSDYILESSDGMKFAVHTYQLIAARYA